MAGTAGMTSAAGTAAGTTSAAGMEVSRKPTRPPTAPHPALAAALVTAAPPRVSAAPRMLPPAVAAPWEGARPTPLSAASLLCSRGRSRCSPSCASGNPWLLLLQATTMAAVVATAAAATVAGTVVEGTAAAGTTSEAGTAAATRRGALAKQHPSCVHRTSVFPVLRRLAGPTLLHLTRLHTLVGAGAVCPPNGVPCRLLPPGRGGGYGADRGHADRRGAGPYDRR